MKIALFCACLLAGVVLCGMNYVMDKSDLSAPRIYFRPTRGFAETVSPNRVVAQVFDRASTPILPVSQKADFSTRCSRPEVVRCFGFDDQTQTDAHVYPPSGQKVKRARVVTDIKVSGRGALRFEIPSESGADTSGSFWLNFSDDLKLQFGENAEFYVQWLQRFSPEFLGTMFQNGGGWKQAIIGTGDQPGKQYFSCTDLEIVVQNTYQRGFAQMYNSCSGSTSHRGYDPFQEGYATADWKLQNARPSPYCLYSQGSKRTYFPPEGNCFGYFANEWMTFQIHLKVGPRVGDEFVKSYVDMWIGKEGKASEPVFIWGPYNLSAGPATADQKFGKIWLLPYHTGKDPFQVHPAGYVWYDELVISRKRIPDPELSRAKQAFQNLMTP